MTLLLPSSAPPAPEYVEPRDAGCGRLLDTMLVGLLSIVGALLCLAFIFWVMDVAWVLLAPPEPERPESPVHALAGQSLALAFMAIPGGLFFGTPGWLILLVIGTKSEGPLTPSPAGDLLLGAGVGGFVALCWPVIFAAKGPGSELLVFSAMAAVVGSASAWRWSVLARRYQQLLRDRERAAEIQRARRVGSSA